MTKLTSGLLGLILVLLSCAALVSASLDSADLSDHAEMMAADPSYDPTLIARVPVRKTTNNHSTPPPTTSVIDFSSCFTKSYAFES
jgi:hypothetical protein